MIQTLNEVQKSLDENEIFINTILVCDSKIISRGHNLLIQHESAILHYTNRRKLCLLYKINSINYFIPHYPLCSRVIILYNIPHIVICENNTLKSVENLLLCNDVRVTILNDFKSRDFFLQFTANNLKIWNKKLKKIGNTTEAKKMEVILSDENDERFIKLCRSFGCEIRDPQVVLLLNKLDKTLGCISFKVISSDICEITTLFLNSHDNQKKIAYKLIRQIEKIAMDYEFKNIIVAFETKEDILIDIFKKLNYQFVDDSEEVIMKKEFKIMI